MMNSVAMLRQRHLRALEIIRAGKLTCRRCGGGGIYHTYGTCFRCGGDGIDPQQPKHPAKSKLIRGQQRWASQYDAAGELIERTTTT